VSSDPAAADVQDAKRRLRKEARTARAAAAAADRAEGAQAGEALRDVTLAALAPRLSDLEPGAVISAYWPMGDEIDPRPLLQALHSLGRRLALPSPVT